MTNELLLSVSLDCTVKIWRVETGECIRTIEDPVESTCCAFHPLNNNIFFVGNKKGKLKTYNLSTGQVSQLLNTSGAVTSMTFDPTGDRLFLSDSKVSYFHYINISIILLFIIYSTIKLFILK